MSSLEKLLSSLYLAGLGMGATDDIEDPEEKDLAIINPHKHYVDETEDAILKWIDEAIGTDEDDVYVGPLRRSQVRSELRQKLGIKK